LGGPSFTAVTGSSTRRLVPAPRVVHEDLTAERLDAVLEADQAGAPGEVGAADAVVADRDAQDGVCRVGVHGDRDDRGVRVFLAALVSAWP
jgi:hypothetical protein